jgi:hypothetical protein
LGPARWVRSHPLDGELVTFYQPAKGRKHLTAQHRPSKSSASRKHAKREKEPWLLVVSPSLKAFCAARVVDYYRSRMQIEIYQPCCLHKSVYKKLMNFIDGLMYPNALSAPLLV